MCKDHALTRSTNYFLIKDRRSLSTEKANACSPWSPS